MQKFLHRSFEKNFITRSMLRRFCYQRLTQKFAPSMRRLFASAMGSTQSYSRAANDPFQDFYRYTSGRFLYDEDVHLKERYKKFSVPALKEAATKAISASSCTSMTKLAEGSQNRIFLLTMDTGKQVIARIPYPCAGPAHYTTASEVATMHYLRTRLKMPVPQVFAYSSDPLNPVGSEYIIMEKVDGVDFFSRWVDFNIETKRNIVRSLADIQSRLLDVQFSSLGCLYFKDDVPKNYRAPRLYDTDHADDSTYCIGPSTAPKFWDPQRVGLGVDPGPWSSPHECWIAICQREIAWIRRYAVSRTEDDPLRQVDSQEDSICHIQQLKRCIKMAPLMTPPFPMSVGTLWHDDLNFGNILISNNDINPHIVSILNWQNASIGSLYLQFCEPHFFDCLKEYESIYRPNGIKNKSDTEYKLGAKLALEVDELRPLYLESIIKRYPYIAEARSIPYAELQKILMLVSGTTWTMEDKIISLRHNLFLLSHEWESYGFGGRRPFPVSLEEIHVHFDEYEWAEKKDDFKLKIMRRIGMSYIGEVELDEYQDRKLLLEDIKLQLIEAVNSQGDAQAVSKKKVNWEKYWPFRYSGLGR